jgi:hypothetical protein
MEGKYAGQFFPELFVVCETGPRERNAELLIIETC